MYDELACENDVELNHITDGVFNSQYNLYMHKYSFPLNLSQKAIINLHLYKNLKVNHWMHNSPVNPITPIILFFFLFPSHLPYILPAPRWRYGPRRMMDNLGFLMNLADFGCGAAPPRG